MTTCDFPEVEHPGFPCQHPDRPGPFYNVTTWTEYATEEQAFAAYQNHRANREQVCVVDANHEELFCNHRDH
jgi:hypothetical protein